MPESRPPHRPRELRPPRYSEDFVGPSIRVRLSTSARSGTNQQRVALDFILTTLLARFAVAAARFGDGPLLAEIVFAVKESAGNNRFDYQQFWKGCIGRYGEAPMSPDTVFAHFCELGLLIEHASFVGEVLATLASKALFLPCEVWNQLATVALRTPNPQTVLALWEGTLPSRKFLSHYEFGLFAELAVVIND